MLTSRKRSRAISRVVAIIIIVAIVLAGVGGYLAYQYLTPQPKITLTVATFGGTTLQAFENVVNASGFEQKYNVKVQYFLESTTLGTLAKIQASPNNPPAEIWLGSPQPALIAAGKGVLQPLDISQLTAIQSGAVSKSNLLMGNGTAWAIADQREYNSILVNTDVWKPSSVTSWKWLWDPALKGQIGIWDVSGWSGFSVYQVAKIWGGNENNTDIGFQKLKELAPNIGAVLKSQDQADQLLASKQVTVELSAASGVYDFYTKGNTSVHIAALAPPDTPAFFTTDDIMLVKNNIVPLSTEYAFLNMLLTVDSQNILSCTEAESPVNVQANPASSCPAVGPILNSVSFPNNSWSPNLQVVVKNYNAWSQRWATEIVPLIGA